MALFWLLLPYKQIFAGNTIVQFFWVNQICVGMINVAHRFLVQPFLSLFTYIRPEGIVFQETHESSWSSWKPSMASKVLETQYLQG